MGTFASSANAGDLLGTAIFSVIALGIGGSWYIVTFITSITMAVMAALFAIFGEERPPRNYRAIIDDEVDEVEIGASPISETYDATEKHGISFFEAWKVPGVALYACSYGAIK
jgi:hypothetical protein